MAITYTEIPLRTDLPAYTQEVVLSGSVYQIGISYNARMQRWLMDIMDSTGAMMLAGIPLLVSFPLTDQYIGRIAGFPTGQFIVIDETGAERNPTRDTLGVDIKLIYAEEV